MDKKKIKLMPGEDKRLEKLKARAMKEEEKRAKEDLKKEAKKKKWAERHPGEKQTKFVKGSKEEERAKISRRKKLRIFVINGALFYIIISAVLFYFKLINFFVGLTSLVILVFVYLIVQKRLKRYGEVKKMEDVFPDFVALMASNLRAGMTVDRALLMSSRKEFAPLDKEIFALGKDIVTGREIGKAMLDMADRIGSSEIKKTTMLIISGIRSGGNLSVLLEQVSSSMRERMFVRKRAASNVLMYIIFIFFASAVGAPFLFALSSVLVGVLSSILSDIPTEQISSVNLPFSLTQISISPIFVLYFSVVFVVVTDILASLMIGLVSKGSEREGMKYILPLIALSMLVFFGARTIVLSYFSDFFS